MSPPRMKADARRRLVLEAALQEFGRAGLDSVSVSAIAERAGVSQPYVFQLFGTKKALFIACVEERTLQILEAFRAAAADHPDSPLEAMAAAYVDLLAHDPTAIRSQLHAWASSSDPAIGEAARASYLSIWREAQQLGGATGEEIRDFIAQGMLLSVLAALDIPDLYADPDLLNRKD